MDCRTARTLMAGEDALAPDEQQAYRAHLQTCAACRDDAADPLSRALNQTMIEMALPPPDFTARLLQRLPQASPLELAARETRQRRQRVWVSVAGGVLVLALFIVFGVSVLPAWSGTSLGLIAGAIQRIASAALVPLIAMLASAVALAWLLQLALKLPTLFRTLGGAGLAVGLLLIVGNVVALNDAANATAGTAAGGSRATILRSIQADRTTSGDVASLFGDITVRSNVGGDVASVLGDVTIDGARVAGDVFAGTGRIDAPTGAIAGQALRGPAGLALSGGLGSNTVQDLSPNLVRTLSGVLAALITLALAALLVLLWPQRTLQTARLLPTRPWLALGLGVLITALLALLALPLLALLALTVVGLLLVPLLLMAVHLPYVQGLAAVGQALGQRLTGSVTPISALWGVAAQLVLVVGLSIFAPLAGLALFYLLGSLGLGALVLDRRALI